MTGTGQIGTGGRRSSGHPTRDDLTSTQHFNSTASEPIAIQDERVLRGGRLGLFVILSVIALAAIARFTVWWVTIPESWEYPVPYIGISLVIAYESAVWLTRWFPLLRMRRPGPLAPEPGLRVAVVTTIVPETEPVAMLEQTLRALVGLDYPHDTWVLDEGDDPEVRALCDRLGARHFSRRHRPEYRDDSGPFASRTKYGNYNAWLDTPESTRYDYLAAFDTDHVPEPDYLERTLGYFRDPGVGYVQAPQVYYNQSASFVARGAAEETYDYYSSHQMAGYALGHPIIVGSHNLHRLAALRALGGLPRYDAEDLRLTLLYRTQDWRGVYVPEVLALGCTPVRWRDYLVQQARWARSVLELKRSVLRKGFPALRPHEWLMGLLHGVHFLRPLLWLILYPLLFRMLLNNRVPPFLRPGPLLTLFCMGLLLRAIDQFRQLFYLDPKHERGLHWRAMILQFAKWPHFVGALIDTLLRRRIAYTLTPKVAGGTERYILAPVHIGLALSLCGAWAIGVIRIGGVEPVLTALAGLVAGASLILAWTETWDFPPPYDPLLLPQRRAAMGNTVEDRAG